MKHFSPLYDELGPKFEQVVVKLSTLRCIFSFDPTRATHQQIKQEVPKKTRSRDHLKTVDSLWDSEIVVHVWVP